METNIDSSKRKLLISLSTAGIIIILSAAAGIIFPGFGFLSWLIWVGGLVGISTSVNQYFQRKNKLTENNQTRPSNNPRGHSSTAKTVGWVCVILIIIGTGFGIYQFLGGTRDTQITVPQFLKGAQISFNVPVYYQIGSPEESTTTFQKINRAVVLDKSLSQYYPGRFTYEQIPKDEKFSIIGAINEAQYGLSAIDAGTQGVNFLILKDQNDQEAFMANLEFDTRGFLNPNRSTVPNTSIASYYINGSEVGPINYTVEGDMLTK